MEKHDQRIIQFEHVYEQWAQSKIPGFKSFSTPLPLYAKIRIMSKRFTMKRSSIFQVSYN